MARSDAGDLAMKVGQGNWRAIDTLDIDIEPFLAAAERWREQAAGVDKPWLVWCAHPDWAIIQQKLVLAAGWTPIVGNDPRVSNVPVLNGSIYIDFNAGLGLPLMYPHFPVELAFAWIDRLAFWHSDLLLTEPQMREYGEMFAALPDGTCAATRPGNRIRERIKEAFRRRYGRYWELLGCTTAGASRSQWETGAGWWARIDFHLNCPDAEREERVKWYWDHGTGIKYWAKKKSGNVRLIWEEDIAGGHFTKIGNPNYLRDIPANRSQSGRSMEGELTRNFKLQDAARTMGLERLFDAPIEHARYIQPSPIDPSLSQFTRSNTVPPQDSP